METKEEDKLEKYEKYALSIGGILMFGTISIFIIINSVFYGWDIVFAYLMGLPMLFSAYMANYWFKQIKKELSLNKED